MDIHIYFGLCADHDWNYFFSSNQERRNDGEMEAEVLLFHYGISVICSDIYNAWYTFEITNKGQGIKPKFDDFIGDVYEGVENSDGC